MLVIFTESYYDTRIHEYYKTIFFLFSFPNILIMINYYLVSQFRSVRKIAKSDYYVNPLKPELNPICYLLALLAHHFLHVSRIRVKSLTLGLLMFFIYIYIYICDISSLRVKYQHFSHIAYIMMWHMHRPLVAFLHCPFGFFCLFFSLAFA